jgi:mono/diheme cytochrome c family protein/rhodanese-related sulfurtransferase
VKRLALLVIAAALAACQSGSAKPRPPAGPPAPGTYVKLCAPCHGVDAKGYKSDHAPSLVSPTFLESVTDDFLRRSIIYGRPGTPMAAYGKVVGGPLDGPDVDRIIEWLRKRGPALQRIPGVATGDPMRGAAIYAQNCKKCHGDAQTRGDAVFLANARFQALATNAFIAYAVEHGRPGTPMPAWQGKLTGQQIEDVVAYVRQLGTPAAAKGVYARPDEHLLPPPTGKEPLVQNPDGRPPRFTLRADPCPPPRPGQPACKPDPRYVPAAQVQEALAQHRRMIIIDARPASDWMRVHLPGAVSIPYHDLHRLAELPKDGTWIVAYCACPHHLSGIVVDELRKRGYAHAVVLDEGILEWQRRGYPVVAAPGVTAPPAEPARPPAPGRVR